MARRLELQTELEELLGTRNVYFQPPESKKLTYPCIIYNRRTFHLQQANNYNYLSKDCYDVTIIYRDPDSDLPQNMLNKFSYCAHNRKFVADNLYHDVFTLYY